jgi:nicotinate phosphoribosyltransferase
MKMHPIVEHFLDSTDHYKLTIGAAILRKFPDTWVKWKFKCRNVGIVWTQEMVDEINAQLDHLCTLRVTEEEVAFVRSIRYIPKGYPEFLRMLQLDRSLIKVRLDEDGVLNIESEGPWFLTTYFEIPVLAIVNEVYFYFLAGGNRAAIETLLDGAEKLLSEKIQQAKFHQGFTFTDFGTRRRFSKDWQESVIARLAKELPGTFNGTSNPYFAMKYGLTPIGTVAHEWYMVGQALENVTLAHSQSYMLQSWVDVYRGDLGTALSDTLGTDKFLKDFDQYFAKLYDGLRHDSGDPFDWGEKILDHYESMNVSPINKTLVFSDGLTMSRALELFEHFKGRVRTTFGIGTSLTNDIPGVTPLNIIMKLDFVNSRPVAKLSDNPGKRMCSDPAFLSYLLKVVAE